MKSFTAVTSLIGICINQFLPCDLVLSYPGPVNFHYNVMWWETEFLLAQRHMTIRVVKQRLTLNSQL